MSKKTTSRKARADNWTGYLIISPWLIGFLVFLLLPGAYMFVVSFTKWDMIAEPVWVGFDNYLDLLDDPLFRKSLYVTIRFVAVSVAASMVFALLLALLLNQNTRIMYVFRTIYYVPSVVSGVAVAIVWSWIFSPDFGFLNYVLSWFGIPAVNWLGDPAYAPWAFVLMMSTTFVGAPMIIFLAGLQNIPPHLYEAASIDGANGWQKFAKITLPTLSPIILFNTITMIIGAFRTFVQAYTLAGMDGYPDHSLLFFVMYLYKKAFHDMQMGTAAAMAWVFFLIIFALTFLILKTSGSWVHYEDDRR
jgi:ABC-type sugar transport systems, permease components